MLPSPPVGEAVLVDGGCEMRRRSGVARKRGGRAMNATARMSYEERSSHISICFKVAAANSIYMRSRRQLFSRKRRRSHTWMLNFDKSWSAFLLEQPFLEQPFLGNVAQVKQPFLLARLGVAG
eukprot:1477096-Pleurochrysis_carterae.AAC.1